MRKTDAPAVARRAAQGLVAQDHPGEVLGRAAVLVKPGESGGGTEVLRGARACLAQEGSQALQRLPGGDGHAGQPQQPQGCAAEHAGEPGVGGVLVEAALGGQGQAGEAELRRDVQAAAYPRQALLRLPVGAGNAAGERCFEVAGVEGGEGRDEVCGGAVGEVAGPVAVGLPLASRR